MKRLLSMVLCVMLVIGCSAACAEVKPWASPYFAFYEYANSDDAAMRGELRVTLNMDEAIRNANETKTTDESGPATAVAYTDELATGYGNALAALMSASALEMAWDGERTSIALLVGGKEIAHLNLWTEGSSTDGKVLCTTNLLPSFVFSIGLSEDDDTLLENEKNHFESLERLAALSKEGNGLTMLSDAIESTREQIAYFLNGKDTVTLDDKAYETLLTQMPDLLPGTLKDIMLSLRPYFGTIETEQEHMVFGAQEGAVYHMERAGENGLNAVMSYLETDVDYQKKEDGQGYDRKERQYAVTKMISVTEHTVSYAEFGHADESKNEYLRFDVSDPENPRMVLDSSAVSGSIDFTRDEGMQRMTLALTDSEMALQGALEVDNEGNGMDVLINGTVQNFGTIGFSFQGERAENKPSFDCAVAPDQTRIEATIGASGNVLVLAPEAAEKIKNELYTVTRPMLIDFALSKLPEGAQALSPVLLAAAMQLGR